MIPDGVLSADLDRSAYGEAYSFCYQIHIGNRRRLSCCMRLITGGEFEVRQLRKRGDTNKTSNVGVSTGEIADFAQ